MHTHTLSAATCHGFHQTTKVFIQVNRLKQSKALLESEEGSSTQLIWVEQAEVSV
jgi:hypothetical protein